MQLIVGVVFKKNGRVYYYDPGGISVEIGDKVICHLDDTIEFAEIATPIMEVSKDDISYSLSKIIRKATYNDLSVDEINKRKEENGYKKFEELTGKHNLAMKLIDVHVIFDKSKMIFSFTSEKRVDFREIVKELASYFKIRIELRQIGVRDEAKMLGGLGPCGRNLCCRSFLTDFQSISVKMARDQNLPLNPLKISGICGRLMCCLKYEYDEYKKFLEEAPERGLKVKCSYGHGAIGGYEPLKKKVIVELGNESRVSVLLSQVEVVESSSSDNDSGKRAASKK